MYELPKEQITDSDKAILRRLRVWILALGLTCLAAGVGIGALITGRPVVAQTDVQVARAPEALSASFAEIAKNVEPAVVNIDTKTAARTAPTADDDKDSPNSSNPLLEMFRKRSSRPSYAVGSGFI